jgi:hypothetical protein
MSDDEKEIWVRAYVRCIGHYLGPDHGSATAIQIANRAVDDFKKRFDKPENYREPGR